MFDIVILIGAICGPIMVIGSMALLYSGAISLRGAACDGEALSIELIKEIKLSTRYPALALFLIGFIFFISAAWFAQQGNVKKIRLDGVVSSPNELVGVEIILSAGSWKRDIRDQTGRFSFLFHPNVENLSATFVAPGYENSGVSKMITIDSDSSSIGEIDLGKRIVNSIQPQENIPPRQGPEPSDSRGLF